MDVIIYIYMFIIGTVLGSFYTLAVYRIPLKQDITHTRSYCPKCNHKLNFWDLIPVLSYLFLGGKCRYCKNKIRPRYLIIEVLSGFAFLLFAICININLLNIEYIKLGTLIYGMMFFSVLFITIAIFKEHKRIENSVFVFGVITSVLYMVYLYILNRSIYRYIIYVPLLLLMVMICNISKKEYIKVLCFLMFLFINFYEIFTVVLI